MRQQTRRQRLPVWIYVLVNLAATVLQLLIVERRHPGLAEERLRPGPGAKDGLLRTIALFLPPWTIHLVVAALDVRRLHWSDTVPFRLQVAGLVGFAASIGIVLWAMAVNTFFSSVVRIQRERGHYVVTSGPYRYVRHPGYLASILLLFFSGMALGSWLSMVPGLAWLPLIIRRAIIEDRVLKEELEGYAAYAERVRYRLVPGLW